MCSDKPKYKNCTPGMIIRYPVSSHELSCSTERSLSVTSSVVYCIPSWLEKTSEVLAQSYMDTLILTSLLVSMGISTFTSKEFVIFCRVSRIGNEKIMKKKWDNHHNMGKTMS